MAQRFKQLLGRSIQLTFVNIRTAFDRAFGRIRKLLLEEDNSTTSNINTIAPNPSVHGLELVEQCSSKPLYQETNNLYSAIGSEEGVMLHMVGKTCPYRKASSLPAVSIDETCEALIVLLKEC